MVIYDPTAFDTLVFNTLVWGSVLGTFGFFTLMLVIADYSDPKGGSTKISTIICILLSAIWFFGGFYICFLPVFRDIS